MSYYYFLEIPLLFIGITLWIFCCYYVKQRRESEEALVFRESPSVYVIPMYDEEQEDVYDACYGQSYRECALYGQRELGMPPPYRLEPPSYIDAAPPSYSELFRDSTGQTVT